jgi:hypothetical protein
MISHHYQVSPTYLAFNDLSRMAQRQSTWLSTVVTGSGHSTVDIAQWSNHSGHSTVVTSQWPQYGQVVLSDGSGPKARSRPEACCERSESMVLTEF